MRPRRILFAILATALAIGCESTPTDTPTPPTGRAAIAGRVIGGLGGPVAGATVTTVPASQSVVTGADGRFVLTGLDERSHLVYVARDSARVAVVETLARADTTELTVRAPRWRLAWSEEFDAPIDSTRWYVEESDRLSPLPNRFRRHAVSVADGRLRITSRPDTVEPGKLTGALLSTRAIFQYGRFEARGQLPRGRGLWPAYWLWPLGKHDAPEIDIMEMLGHEPDLTYHTYHYGDSTGARQKNLKPKRGVDRSAGYHTYAAEWYPGEIRWFIDDVEVHRTPTVQADEPMNFIIDTIVGGTWSGPPDSTTVWPQYHDVEYVRIYTATE